MELDPLIERLREAIRKKAQLSSEELYADMVRRGVIDEQGNVLLRMPEPPKRTNQRKNQHTDEEVGMTLDPLVERLREAIRKRSLLSSEELHADMVRRGVIDEQGNVLLRMPEPPESPKKPKKPKKKPKVEPTQE